jgi:hypothetical protein
MAKKLTTPGSIYKAGQLPTAWLFSAEQLRDAAEVILRDQQAREAPYFQAADEAGMEALSNAILAQDGTATVEIKNEPPNYLPAQLLYAFAIENILKGILSVKNPGWANETRISRKLQTHQLADLAGEAGVQLAVQEIPVADALSHIADWAGCYPVASKLEKYVGKVPLGINPDSLLDWGSHHPIMRRLFNRLHDELLAMLPSPVSRSFGSVTSIRPKIS